MLSKLEVGDCVNVWNNTSKKFDREWKVVAAHESGRSYILRDEATDRVYVRNRRHLYPCTAPAPVNIVMSNPPKNLKTALKNKITWKRTTIIHPRVLFMMDVEMVDEDGNRSFKELATGEEEEEEELITGEMENKMSG